MGGKGKYENDGFLKKLKQSVTTLLIRIQARTAMAGNKQLNFSVEKKPLGTVLS